MRYTVDSHKSNVLHNTIWTIDPGWPLPHWGPFTEAEARICAWALKAVAEGKTLAASPMQDPPWDFEPYDGPTDGVVL